MKAPSGPLIKLLPFLRWWPMVTRKTARDDLLAGFTGALIVLPQGVAFATIAGLPPQYGLYAAMMPAVVGALFGSSFPIRPNPARRNTSDWCSPSLSWSAFSSWCSVWLAWAHW